jgi:hypothetical protein
MPIHAFVDAADNPEPAATSLTFLVRQLGNWSLEQPSVTGLHRCSKTAAEAAKQQQSSKAQH